MMRSLYYPLPSAALMPVYSPCKSLHVACPYRYVFAMTRHVCTETGILNLRKLYDQGHYLA